jgi:hypothetical protein
MHDALLFLFRYANAGVWIAAMCFMRRIDGWGAVRLLWKIGGRRLDGRRCQMFRSCSVLTGREGSPNEKCASLVMGSYPLSSFDLVEVIECALEVL